MRPMTGAADVSFVVKICGITNEEDARIAIEAGADALGFNFYKASPRYITPARAREIVEAVTGAYWKIGVFVNPGEEELQAACEETGFDVAQLHGNACRTPRSGSYRVWKSIDAAAELPVRNTRIEAYLLDTPGPQFGGSGRTFPWGLAKEFPFRAILAGGLDGENVAEAIATVRPWGVDACSRLEAKPGKKDARRVREFIHNARAASEQMAEISR